MAAPPPPPTLPPPYYELVMTDVAVPSNRGPPARPYKTAPPQQGCGQPRQETSGRWSAALDEIPKDDGAYRLDGGHPPMDTYKHDMHIDDFLAYIAAPDIDIFSTRVSLSPAQRQLKERFTEAMVDALDGKLPHWEDDPKRLTALILLLDQIPRRVYTGRAAYAGDAAVRVAINRAMNDTGILQQIGPQNMLYVCIALSHQESLDEQNLSKRIWEGTEGTFLNTDAGHVTQKFEENWHTIETFGRFPQRNEVLGRTDTAQEAEWLEQQRLCLETQPQHLITVKSPRGAVHRCCASCCSRKGLWWFMVVLAILLLITSWIWIQAIVCYDDPAACECPKRFNSTECESGTSNSRVWIGGNSAGGGGGGGGGGGCFPPGEEVELWGGVRASIESLSPGDRLADGGHVVVTMEIAVSTAVERLYRYNDSVWVTGSHSVLDRHDSIWRHIADSPLAIARPTGTGPDGVAPLGAVFNLVTTSHTFVVNGTLFSDWEETEMTDQDESDRLSMLSHEHRKAPARVFPLLHAWRRFQSDLLFAWHGDGDGGGGYARTAPADGRHHPTSPGPPRQTDRRGLHAAKRASGRGHRGPEGVTASLPDRLPANAANPGPDATSTEEIEIEETEIEEGGFIAGTPVSVSVDADMPPVPIEWLELGDVIQGGIVTAVIQVQANPLWECGPAKTIVSGWTIVENADGIWRHAAESRLLCSPTGWPSPHHVLYQLLTTSKRLVVDGRRWADYDALPETAADRKKVDWMNVY